MLDIALNNYIQAFDTTPQKIKDVLFADFTSSAIKNITHRHNAQNNMLDISATIGYVLVGLIPVKNIIEVLKLEAQLDQNTARNIAYDIREQIFAPIAQELASIQAQAQNSWGQINVLQPQTMLTVAPVLDESITREKLQMIPPALQDHPALELPTKVAPAPPQNLPTEPKAIDNIPPDNRIDLRDKRDTRF